MASFQAAHPQIPFLAPSAEGYAERRETRGQAGQEMKPLGIAMPHNAKQVSDIVRWAATSRVEFTVRSGGNDFYGRNAVDDALIIDMRDIKDITIAQDKSTATIAGGVITKDLIGRFEDEGIVTPFGNTWIVGYVGWATLGGYGPLTNLFGMGIENIVGAEIVNHEGDIIEATDEMLEAIRGMGGNIGIITSLTIKVYPARKLLSGALLFECNPDIVKAVLAAEANLEVPRCVTIHHFVLKMQSRIFAIFFTWSDPDLEKGQKYLDSFIATLPPVKMSTVKAKTPTEHQQDVPLKCLPWGAQRSLYVKRMSPAMIDTLIEALETMPADVNLGWSAMVNVDHASTPKNCFGAGRHILLSFSDMVPDETLLASARAWTDTLYGKFCALGDDAILEGSYPPLTRPSDKTAEQLFGDKWSRAKELKAKFDPNDIFKYAVPRMLE